MTVVLMTPRSCDLISRMENITFCLPLLGIYQAVLGSVHYYCGLRLSVVCDCHIVFCASWANIDRQKRT